MDHKAQNQCELCYQFSHSGSASSTGLCVVLYMIACGAVLLTVCGNLLVIISICCFKHLHTPTNCILLSLALADLLTGLTVMPFHFSLLIESTWYFGTFLCKVFWVFFYILPSASVYSVVFIAVDRYVALQNPFQYSRIMTVNVSVLVICLIWIFFILYSVSCLYFNGNFEHVEQSPGCVTECFVTVSEISGIIDIMCVFIVPFSLIIILYSKVFAVARKHILTMSKHHTVENVEIRYSVASERKAAMKLGILVVVFLLCSIPSYISVFVGFKSTDFSMQQVNSYTLSLVLLNSTFNPVIYALFYPWFRKCVKLILTLNICSSESTWLNATPRSEASPYTITRSL